MNQNPDNSSVRRIVLPSGRCIEVVKLDFEPPPGRGIHLCPRCESQLVQPVRWRQVQPRFWALTLSCPNCACLTEGVFAQEQLDRFEEQLDLGLTELLSDLRRLTRANMSEEIDRFIEALQADRILPEDF